MSDPLYIPETSEIISVESALIGLVIAHEGTVDAALEECNADDFLVELHRNVFELYEKFAEEEKRPRLEEAVEALGGGSTEVVGAGLTLSQYLAKLVADAPAGTTLDVTIDIARDLARRVRTFALIERGELHAEPPPPPYEPRFGPAYWGEALGTRRRYEWLIKGLVPARKRLLLAGPSGSGKTFAAYDMAAHIARGIDYRGRRTKQAGVAYCFYESPEGVHQREEAYRRTNNVELKGLPFVSLLKPPQLFTDVANGKHLADEVKALTREWTVKLGVIVIDTLNASTLGSSEIRSEDISRIIEVHRALCEATDASLWIVGHTNDDGRHRGNKQFTNGIDTELYIEKLENKDESYQRDDAGRIIRRCTLRKQREGRDGQHWDFVLREVELWKDEDGEPVTSMVIDAVADVRAEEEGGVDLAVQARKSGAFWLRNASEIQFFKALLEAIKKHGMTASLASLAGEGVSMVARYVDVIKCYSDLEPQGPNEKDVVYEKRVTARVRDTAKSLRQFGVIATETVEVEGDEPGKKVKRFLLWPTGRKVQGKGFTWPPPPRVVESPVDEVPLAAASGDPF